MSLGELSLWLGLAGKLAWPSAILALALYFGRPISDLIGRVTNVDLAGAKFRARPNQPTGSGEPPGFIPSSQLTSGANDAELQHLADALRNFPELANLTEGKKIEKLLLFAVDWALACSFERAYQFIFGSQLRALQHLNAASPARVTDLRSTYDSVAAANKAAFENYSFEQWLEYMRSWFLIAVDGEAAGITPLGRVFLKYLVNQAYPLDKVF